ncbi:HU family DNA-binding protein [Limnofasciculus baicalensis]|uniref:HU family DNA-binding protein n=1 Tax=Limnofasciculus baicalensis BBK-W-15 TaxID=2699891 RepID=A0AAE3KJX3_9CYAN|nr:HU family DNA-binding protein [Limnofasciculus baicalensis]MCP2726990.1 HU family DNA-binding protein [Limnofasciculus baicalensis BBK-W-15]
MNLLTDIALETDLPLKTVKLIFDLIEEKAKSLLQNSDEPFEFFGFTLSAKNYGQFERRKRNGEPNVIPAQRRIKVVVSEELTASIQNDEVKVVPLGDETPTKVWSTPASVPPILPKDQPTPPTPPAPATPPAPIPPGLNMTESSEIVNLLNTGWLPSAWKKTEGSRSMS